MSIHTGVDGGGHQLGFRMDDDQNIGTKLYVGFSWLLKLTQKNIWPTVKGRSGSQDQLAVCEC